MATNIFINKKLKELQQAPFKYIEHTSFGVLQPNEKENRQGKLEYVYYLTKEGAKYVKGELDYQHNSVNYPIGEVNFKSRDYWHRKYTLDVLIALEAATKNPNYKIKVFFLETYFNKKGNAKTSNNLSAGTKLQYPNQPSIVPDGLFILDIEQYGELDIQKFNKKSFQMIYCLEIYNGKDAKWVTTKLLNYLPIIPLGIPNDYFEKKGLVQSNDKVSNLQFMILVVLENESTQKSVMKRLHSDDSFQPFNEAFLFKTLEDISSDSFFENWQVADGSFREVL